MNLSQSPTPTIPVITSVIWLMLSQWLVKQKTKMHIGILKLKTVLVRNGTSVLVHILHAFLPTCILQAFFGTSLPFSFSIFFCLSEIVCPPLELPTNAVSNTSDTTWHTLANVTCTGGKRFSDGYASRIIECMSNGRWTPLPDDCQGEIWQNVIWQPTEALQIYCTATQVDVTNYML